MTKHYETVHVPEQRLIWVSCDGCDKTISVPYGQTDTVTVSREYGHGESDGGGVTNHVDYDLCGECFQTKLMPALAALGIAPHTEQIIH